MACAIGTCAPRSRTPADFPFTSRCFPAIDVLRARATTRRKNAAITMPSAPITVLRSPHGMSRSSAGGGTMTGDCPSFSATCARCSAAASRTSLQYAGFFALHRACRRFFNALRHSGFPHVRCDARVRAPGTNRLRQTAHARLFPRPARSSITPPPRTTTRVAVQSLVLHAHRSPASPTPTPPAAPSPALSPTSRVRSTSPCRSPR